MVERVSEAVIAVEGEALRPVTHTVITETPSGEWAIGGHAMTAADVKANRSATANAQDRHPRARCRRDDRRPQNHRRQAPDPQHGTSLGGAVSRTRRLLTVRER